MTSKSDNSRRYASLRSLEELRAERERIEWQIENREEALSREYARFREMFSLGYLSGVIAQKMTSFQSIIGGLWNGFQTTFAMVRKHQEARKREKAEEAACEPEERS